ncbi:MAG: alanine racemase, partial [Spirochaetales bacterium]|nr:alanine racemase [Spirochaetales bacterium]
MINQKKYPHALINANALLNNIKIAKEKWNGPLIVPVKANAYGHDSVLVSKVMQDSGLVKLLAVARVDEGLHLRQNGITMPIFTLGVELDDESDIQNAIQNDIELSVSDIENVKTIAIVAEKLNKTISLHIKLDTGFSRLGVNPKNVLELAGCISRSPYLHFASMYTHFAMSESDEDFTRRQLAILKDAVARLAEYNIAADFYHCYNSGAILYGI